MKKFKKASEIKVGVIGYGGAFNMGRLHLTEMKKTGMIPTAVTELDKERLKVAEIDFPGIQTYSSVSEMLKKSDVNVLAIITPHNTHAKLALQCLRAGKVVCSEKPLAITTAECDAMIKAAKENGVAITTYHNRHWDGCVLEAVKQIKEKEVIGEVVRIEAHMGNYAEPKEWWRSSKTISGGILYDWGVHLLEYSLQLLDGELTEIAGFAKKGHWENVWKDDINEDEGFLVARFDNGKWLSLNISSIDANAKNSDRGWLEITGTKGTYVFDHAEYKIVTPMKKGTKIFKGNNPDSEGWRLYQNLADHLVEGKELVISGEWARRPIHILDLANRSALSGKSLKAKYK